MAEEALAQYRKDSDSVTQFIDEPETHFRPSTNADSLRLLSVMFEAYCTASGFWAVSVRSFSERLGSKSLDSK